MISYTNISNYLFNIIVVTNENIAKHVHIFSSNRQCAFCLQIIHYGYCFSNAVDYVKYLDNFLLYIFILFNEHLEVCCSNNKLNKFNIALLVNCCSFWLSILICHEMSKNNQQVLAKFVYFKCAVKNQRME